MTLALTLRNGVEKGMRVFPFLTNKWATLVNLGVTNNLPHWQHKRVRLLNGICAIGFIAQSWFVVTYTAPEERWVFYEALQAALFYLIPIYLNYLHQNKIAFHLFCIYNILIYSWFAIAHGPVDGAEYFLLPSGMAAMLFFRNKRVIFTYFLANLTMFWVCKYLFTVMDPLIVLPFNTYVANLSFLFVVSFLIVYYFKSENQRQEKQLMVQNENLEVEKKKSDNLLLNILPNETALELKSTGKAKTKYFPSATVMFTDFQNFTQMSELLHPEALVEEIHFYFSAFDKIIGNYRIEKIKTIGDSYMCAAGLPHEYDGHATEMLKAALEILDFIEDAYDQKMEERGLALQLRLGIHSGPIVAGIVGTTKFAYDIWGDTVNIASRMESSGEVGRINISGATYELVKDHFHCTYRGKLNAKHKGMMDMYYVEGEMMPVTL